MAKPSCGPGDGIHSGSLLGTERSNLRKESRLADHGLVTVIPNRNATCPWLRPTRNPGTDGDGTRRRLLRSGCDPSVLPSRIDNVPSMALEAQICELSVVAFRVDGLADRVEHRVNGCQAEPEDPQDLALGIDGLPGRDAHTRQGMGRHGRQRVMERCSPDVVAGRCAEVCAQAWDAANG